MNDSVAAQASAIGARRRTSMASAAAILMAGFVLSRVLGLARVAIQARVLGGSTPDATAFTTAIAVPDFIFTVVSGGALGSSFIPVFTGLLERGDEERAWRVASGVMTAIFAVMLAAIAVGELCAPLVVRILNPHGDQGLTLLLTRIMLLQPLFLALSGILMGVHNSYHRFIAPAIAPLVYNIANIAGLLLVPVFHHAVTPAAWGVTIGALLQVVVMVPGFTSFWARVHPGDGLREPETREVGMLMVPRIVGQAGIQLTTLVTIGLANAFLSGGPSPDLRYATNLLFLPVGIFGSAIATAAFPTLSGQAARGDLAALGETVSRTLRTILFFTVPAGLALAVLRYPIVETLLRGWAFKPGDADIVAAGLLLYGIAVPVWAAVELLPRAFFALKDTWTPVLVNLVTLTVSVVLAVAAVYAAHGDATAGVAGLAGAMSAGVVLEVVWLGLLLRRRVATLGLRALGLSLLRAFVAGEAMGVALLALLYLWHHYGPSGTPGNVLLLAIAIPLGVTVYAGWSYLVGSSELETAWAMIRARLGRH